ERQDRPDALAAGQQRVAHRLLQPGGVLGDGRKAQLRQVALDLVAQVLGVPRPARPAHAARRRRRRAHSSESWPGARSARPAARAMRSCSAEAWLASAAQSSMSVDAALVLWSPG